MSFDNQNKMKNTAEIVSDIYYQPYYQIDVLLKNGLYTSIQFETEAQAIEFCNQNQSKGA